MSLEGGCSGPPFPAPRASRPLGTYDQNPDKTAHVFRFLSRGSFRGKGRLRKQWGNGRVRLGVVPGKIYVVLKEGCLMRVSECHAGLDKVPRDWWPGGAGQIPAYHTASLKGQIRAESRASGIRTWSGGSARQATGGHETRPRRSELWFEAAAETSG